MIIGCVDKVDLPSFELNDVPVKIDTGADTSTIHCHKVKEVVDGDKTYLSFHVLDGDEEHRVYEYTTTKITNSFGQSEERYRIKTSIKIFNRVYNSFVCTLSNRSKMSYPILLGKRFLNKRFIVDVSKKDLSFNMKTTTVFK